ncbi:dienelactone hydrolase family protein [Streptantibioticus ferralitis]|uniref:Alpha/beta fold hydrolase n=1 Tax=Streptantibioticus ferralitis TaxID=236510 RepID=A0ABT5YWG7_9ACTN|nr:alpha/beta fold hydrolase [Streptantibioticus ferralitis]MDF2255937.1 alpha/beta fold hydrolase [Streptantibioticus ferralitis]
MTAEWVRLTDGAWPKAYSVLPDVGEPHGAVVLAGEMFGVDDQLRSVAQRLADEAYAVVCPDFYARTGEGPDFAFDEESRARAMELMRGLRREKVIEDLTAARILAVRHAGGGGIAALGFSLGGHLAVLAATSMPFDLVVSYYGGWLLDGGLPLAEPGAPIRRGAEIASNAGSCWASSARTTT